MAAMSLRCGPAGDEPEVLGEVPGTRDLVLGEELYKYGVY